MKQPLLPGHYFHVLNHANGSENLFANEGNFAYFLKRYAKFINPIADTFAYCLMPNHFHFAIRIKSEKELSKLPGVEKYETLSKYCSKQYANLFSSYAQAFNKQQSRRGSLFIPNFERLIILDDIYFRNVIHYIHFNAVHHGFVEDLRDWPHSSFELFFRPEATFLKKEEVIAWFQDRDAFYQFHQKQIDSRMVLDLEYI